MTDSLTNYISYGASTSVVGVITGSLVNIATFPIIKWLPKAGINVFDDVLTFTGAALSSTLGLFAGDKVLQAIYGSRWKELDPTGGVFLLISVVLSNVVYTSRLRSITVDLPSYLDVSYFTNKMKGHTQQQLPPEGDDTSRGRYTSSQRKDQAVRNNFANFL